MASTIACNLDMHNTFLDRQSFDSDHQSTAILCIRILNRHQLYLPTINGDEALIEDSVSPAIESSFLIPLNLVAFPDHLKLYVSGHVLATFGLESCIIDYATPQITNFVVNVVDVNGANGDTHVMVVQLGINKVEVMSEEDARRIAPALVAMDAADLQRLMLGLVVEGLTDEIDSDGDGRGGLLHYMSITEEKAY